MYIKEVICLRNHLIFEALTIICGKCLDFDIYLEMELFIFA